MALVLCTGVYASLRKLILEKAGHEVVTAFDDAGLVDACQQHAFDVAVIGHHGLPGLKRQWLAMIRKYCPSTRVLEVYVATDSISLPDADDWLETPVTAQLGDSVSRLAGEQRKARRGTMSKAHKSAL